MAARIKLATCCYCGAKATLALTGARAGRRELACRSCGAPLRKLKALPAAETEPPRRRAPDPRPRRRWEETPRRKKRRPKRASSFMRLLRKIADEIGDELEDLFD